MTGQSEEILVNRSKIGDIEAFEELISKYQKRVFNIVLRIVGNADEAEDVSQEVFLKVFKSIAGFKGNSSFYTWLYRITINECMDFIKKRKKTAAYSLDAPLETDEDELKKEVEDKSESTEDKVERKEVREYIVKALMTLTAEYRSVIVLRDIQGFSYEEIAHILKCPEGTVKSRINRARSELKNRLSKNMELFAKYNVK